MKRKHEKALRGTFPESWRTLLGERLRWWSMLGAGDRERMEDLIRVFLADKSFEGTRGFEPSEEMKIQIAAQACLLILGLDYDFYDDVTSIIVSPTVVHHNGPRHLDGGIVSDDHAALSGQAMLHGPVLIAWDRLFNQALHPDRGHNVVFHEFAHKLDMRNGSGNGVPPMSAELKLRWEPALRSILQRLRRGGAASLDAYGGTNPAELLAVATEAFFDIPVRLQRDEPDLYGLLRAFYRQDPAARLTASSG
ncbi:MAG: zinc-dependent peptidase [Acidimicrobiia bacterium]|nr:zinc-dependent peptidase [Acidimicrobiia bacterium]